MKKILLIGDGHVGSKFGLNHPDYISPDMERTSDCRLLYNKFCDVRDKAGKVDYVFVGADMQDGWNPFEHGDDRVAEEKKQIEISARLLHMIKGSPKFICVEGSTYHQNTRKLDELLAEKLNAPIHSHYRSPAPATWNIYVERVEFNLAHPITVSKSTWQYQTTPIAREEVLAILNDNKASVILRWHAHYFVFAGYTEHIGIVCPGFQTKTPFQGRVSPLGEYRVGALMFTVDKGEWDWYRVGPLLKTKPEVLKLH